MTKRQQINRSFLQMDFIVCVFDVDGLFRVFPMEHSSTRMTLQNQNEERCIRLTIAEIDLKSCPIMCDMTNSSLDLFESKLLSSSANPDTKKRYNPSILQNDARRYFVEQGDACTARYVEGHWHQRSSSSPGGNGWRPTDKAVQFTNVQQNNWISSTSTASGGWQTDTLSIHLSTLDGEKQRQAHGCYLILSRCKPGTSEWL